MTEREGGEKRAKQTNTDLEMEASLVTWRDERGQQLTMVQDKKSTL